MSFPNTRHTLIQRIAVSGQEDDWRQFLSEYWRPVCRFAARWGRLRLDEADDVASMTFEAVIRSKLLERWIVQRNAKLRTLLCSVVRNILSNSARLNSGRCRIVREHGGALNHLMAGSFDAAPDQIDIFYAAWAEELLQTAFDRLLSEYHQEGKGDYFRVLYGRICEEMTMPEISESLGIKISSAENYYRHARKRLGDGLEQLVRQSVVQRCPEERVADEFQAEWIQLGEFLRDHGGLEQSLRKSFEEFDAPEMRKRESASLTSLIKCLRDE